MDRLRVAEGAALGDPDRVDVADQVADARVGGGELLAVPVRAVQPGDRQVVAALGDRRCDAGVIGRSGCSLSSEPAITGVHSSSSVDQRADQPGLALAALAEQHHVVPGEQRPFFTRDSAPQKKKKKKKKLEAILARGDRRLRDFLLETHRQQGIGHVRLGG